MSCCEQSNECPGSIQGRKFLEYLHNYWSVKTLLHGVGYLAHLFIKRIHET